MRTVRSLPIPLAIPLALLVVALAAVPVPAAAASGDTTADRVIGQVAFNLRTANLVDARSLGGPIGVAIDRSVVPNRVWVIDGFQDRVLGWRDEAALRNGVPADLVIGQPDFHSDARCNRGGRQSASTFCSPTSLAVDGAGNLFVADKDNQRVLEFDSPFTTDTVADRAYGQHGNLEPAESECDVQDDLLCSPWGVAVDAEGGLWIADTGNHRLVYHARPLAPVRTPRVLDIRFEDCTFVDSCGPFFIAVDAAGNLWARVGPSVLGFERPLETDMVPERVIEGSPFTCDPPGPEARLCEASGLVVDAAGTLWVASAGQDRVLGFEQPFTTDVLVDRVLGQPGLGSTGCNAAGLSAASLCRPWGLALDGDGHLWVADEANHRVLEFPRLETGAPAARALGQVLLDQNGVNMVDAAGLLIPVGVAIDRSVSPNRLWVADSINHRVLGWSDVSTLRNGQPADVVVGQPSFFHYDCNTGGRSARSLCASESPGASGFLRVAVDRRGNLWVADVANNRVLGYDDPFATDTVADRVLGQRGFTAGECNARGLSAASLCQPSDLVLDHQGNLYIADARNSRVLRFDAPPARDAVADAVWGQHGSFTTGDCNRGGVSAESLCFPLGVEVDGAGRLYVADGNGRVLGFRDARSGDATADLVLGGSFTRSTCSSGGISARTLCQPTAVTAGNDGDLYVVDTGNNRVLRFDAPWRRFRATQVFGQGGSFTTGQPFFNGLSADSLGTPYDAAVDEDGNLYVVDALDDRVLIFDAP